ncbi:MAG: PLD nuclease N-terminal domain-containing protein [Oscillospiraceae bacterium]|nr:PLD nuclease N-terminal domain-containing protein [Oscillospiraceae bacterium]
MGQEIMDELQVMIDWLPLLIPLIIIQTGLMIFAIVHIVRNQNYKVGNMVIWLLIVLLVDIIGPILYFIIGRGESKDEGDEYDDD